MQEFNGKKWEKFNSEKVASLAYARIQGKTALVSHFQNSSLMNEDKRCRPIYFHSEGSEAGEEVLFTYLMKGILCQDSLLFYMAGRISNQIGIAEISMSKQISSVLFPLL